MAGWDHKAQMSNNACLAVKAGMIPFQALSEPEREILRALDDDACEEATAPHHVEIDGATYFVPFVEASAVGREPMSVEEIAEHLGAEWDTRQLQYKVVWR